MFLEKSYINKGNTCQYCFSPTTDPILSQKNTGIEKIEETKDFYKPMLKILTCIKCDVKVHEICYNDSQKKKSSNTF